MEFENKSQVTEYAIQRREVCEKLKHVITDQLALSIDPAFITDDQPLFGRGLELDSIDALELAIGIYNEFGLTLSDGQTDVFSSVNTMADYVMENSGEENVENLDDGMMDDIASFDEL